MSSYHHFFLHVMAISLILVIVALLILPLDAQNDFRVKLRHVDSGANLTKFELLQRALKRDEKRFQNLYAMALATSYHRIKSPILAGNVGFLLDLSIGTPPQPYLAILDTGSALIWTQCLPCEVCFDPPTSIFDPSKSCSFSKLQCSNNLCAALLKWPCSPNNSCEYLNPYGSGSTQGFLATETLGFGKALVPNVWFGCGINNTGIGLDQSDGIVGLGRGPLSLVSQLNVTVFSYCLPSYDSNKTGTLWMGPSARGKTTDQGGSIILISHTPLIKNQRQPSLYYLSLEGIAVGHTMLHINKSTFAIKSDGSGGMIIDSGTMITYIEETAFNLTKKELIKQVKLPVVDASRETGLDLCFELKPNATEYIFPELIFHFEGLYLALPEENYIQGFDVGVACLMMAGSRELPFSVFGNFQQQRIKVVYDLEGQTLSFLPGSMCHQL